MQTDIQSTFRYPDCFSSHLIDRLYQLAARLERHWHGAGLGDSFASKRIEETLRLLERANGALLPETEQAIRAERLLRWLWQRCARRDAARHARAVAAGRHLTSVPLSLPGIETHPALAVDLYEGGGTPQGGSLFLQEAAYLLEREGWSRMHVRAYLWRVAWECEWIEVALLLASQLGIQTTPAQLRQWNIRYFPRMTAVLRTAYEK